MASVLTEVGVKYAITRWKEKFGTQPDVESPDFKAFQKQVNKDYNDKYAQKASNGDNIASYRNKLAQILEKSPNSFPQEFYNALTNLRKDDKVKLCNMLLNRGGDSTDMVEVNMPDQFRIWVEVIGNLYNTNKGESADITVEALKEGTKYPWISGLLNQRLIKEDDFNLDNFDASVAGAGGMNISSDSNSTDSTTTDTSTQDNGDFNLDDIDSSNVGGGDDLHITPAGGAIDSVPGGGMGDMDDGSMGAPANSPTYRVIDVIFDDKDPEAAPKVKVQNVETGEVEIKDIYEIDV